MADKKVELEDVTLCAMHLHQAMAAHGDTELFVIAEIPREAGRGLWSIPQCHYVNCESSRHVFRVWPVQSPVKRLEEMVIRLRCALQLCADDEGWPELECADAFEASKKLVPITAAESVAE